MIPTDYSPEAVKRERGRLSQIRHRKRKKALAEGKPEDFYITDQDFYQDGATFDPPKRPERAQSAKSDTTRAAPESPALEPLSPAKTILYVALFILVLFAYLIFQEAKERFR